MQHLNVLVKKFGPWQKYNLILTFISILAVSMNHSYMSILAPSTSDYWCSPPILLKDVPEHIWKNYSIPLEGVNFSKCRQYEFDYGNMTLHEYLSDGMLIKENSQVTEACENFHFKESFWKMDLVQQFQLVCDRSKWVKIIDFSYQLGVILGTFIFGHLADKLGRKTIAIFTLIVWIFADLSVAFSTNILTFIAIRFVIASVNTACKNACFVLCHESLSKGNRRMHGTLIFLGFPIGILILALVSYTTRHWRNIQFFTVFPLIVLGLLAFGCIESLEWQLSCGKIDVAVKKMKIIGQLNKVELPQNDTQIITNILTSEKAIGTELSAKKISILDLFRNPNTRKRTIAGCFICFVSGLAHSVLSLDMTEFQSDPFLRISLSASFEIGFLIITIFLIKITGQRFAIASSISIASASIASSIFIPETAVIFKSGVCLLGKSSFAAVIAVMNTFVLEYTPTMLRSLGISMCVLSTFIGSLLAPLSNELAFHSNAYVPLIMYSCLGIMSGFAVLALPHISKQHLPGSIQEAENVGRKIDTDITMQDYHCSEV